MRCVVLACIGVVSGCTHHQPVAALSEIAGEDVRVEVSAGYDDEEGVVVPKQGGDVYIRTERGDFQLNEVEKITDVRRGRGAFEGFGLGIIIGGGLGAMMGYAGGQSGEFSRKDNMIISGILLGGLGGIVGLVVGAVIGSRDVYETGGTQTQTRVIPIGPHGSAIGATVRF